MATKTGTSHPYGTTSRCVASTDPETGALVCTKRHTVAYAPAADAAPTTTDAKATKASATKAPKGRKENSDMATKAPKTNGTEAAPEVKAEPFFLPAPGTGRITLQVQEYLAAQGLRRCAGIAKIGHEQHDAPVAEFGNYAKGLLGKDPVCKASWSQYTKALREAKAALAPAKPVKAPKPESVKTAKPRAAKAPATAAETAAPANGEAEAAPTAGTKAAAAAAARAQVRREAQAAQAAKRAARTKPAPTAAPEAEGAAEPVVAAAEAAADDLPF